MCNTKLPPSTYVPRISQACRRARICPINVPIERDSHSGDATIVQLWHHPGDRGGGKEQESHIKKRGAEIGDVGGVAECDRPDGGGDAPDVVAEAGAGGAKQSRKQ